MNLSVGQYLSNAFKIFMCSDLSVDCSQRCPGKAPPIPHAL